MPERHLGSGRGMASSLADAPAEIRFFLRRLALLGALILALLAIGTVGYTATEGTSLGFSFIWTLDTIATIGSIGLPDDTVGRILTVFLIIFGVGTLFYALVTVTEFFVAGRLSGLLAERRSQRMIDSLTDHHLICGFGRVGRQVARDLRVTGQEFVVVDDNPENREIAEDMDATYLDGRPSEDDVLRRAGIQRAQSVLACMDSDAENIFTTLSARELRPDITIVARASVEDSEKKLKRAGADRVISPYKASGAEMARLALHPQVAGVVTVAPEYRMEEIDVSEDCDGVGKRISEIRGTATIVALRRVDGKVEPQPAGDRKLQAGDVLMAMGTRDAMDRLEHIFESRSAPVTERAG
jgi:voltage-gated potassium channel